MSRNINGISLFSSAGIGEYYLDKIGIKIKVANELLERRAKCYKFLHPKTKMIVGDIQDKSIKNAIKASIDRGIKLLIATPPCQGLSTLGKNKKQRHYEIDKRNFLVFDILEIIDSFNFDYIIIENVPKFLKMTFPYGGSNLILEEILRKKYSKKYNIEVAVLDAKDYGVPQSRNRAIIRIFKKGLTWKWPIKEKVISLKQAIGHLPSLESGEKTSIKWHSAKKENERYILALKHTPTGKSALKNEVFYPKKENGERIKGFHNTFKRMSWDQPAHARTTFCGSVNSHNNVHPGRLLKSGLYSDARALTPLETFIVSSLPINISFPNWATETFLNTIIGESIPPLMLKKIIAEIFKGGNINDEKNKKR